MAGGKESIKRKKLRTNLIDLAQSQHIILPDHFANCVPKKWEQHSDLIVFPSNAFNENFWHQFEGDTLWQMIARQLKVTRLAKQDRIKSNDYRSPNVHMLLGSDPWALHIDNKIKYTFNITKCMFSSGNITEKMRMAKLDCSGETVVDMFAGIGYFTLPILIHGKADHVYSCEWNPDAAEALRRNLELNGVSGRCDVFFGDNRKTTPQGIADRIILGLIPTAEESYQAACRSLNQQYGGWMHIHANVESKQDVEIPCIDVNVGSCYDDAGVECTTNQSKLPTCNRKLKPAWLKWGLQTCLKLKEMLTTTEMRSSEEKPAALTIDWDVKVKHIERIKSYAPHIDHLVADVYCCPIHP